MKALTPAEIHKVLKVASVSKRNHAMILLAYKHGMRASEVCKLKMSDVDQKNGQITIRRLKGSLTTTQPLSDMSGQPLLSENTFSGLGSKSVKIPAITYSPVRRAGNWTALRSTAYSNPSQSKPDFRQIGDTRIV